MPEANAIQEPHPEIPLPAESPRQLKFKDSARDWLLRGVFFAVFLYFGTGKFKSAPDSAWVQLFNRVGVGQWFRYFTAVFEIAGAVLLLFSLTVELGLAVLIAVTFGAIAVSILVLHRTTDALFPFALMCAMIAFWMHRRRV